MVEIPETLQEILRSRLPFVDSEKLAASDELVGLGLDSMTVVQLLGDLEETYGIELPDDILNEETFATVGSLWLALAELLVPGAWPDAAVPA